MNKYMLCIALLIVIIILLLCKNDENFTVFNSSNGTYTNILPASNFKNVYFDIMADDIINMIFKNTQTHPHISQITYNAMIEVIKVTELGYSSLYSTSPMVLPSVTLPEDLAKNVKYQLKVDTKIPANINNYFTYVIAVNDSKIMQGKNNDTTLQTCLTPLLKTFETTKNKADLKQGLIECLKKDNMSNFYLEQVANSINTAVINNNQSSNTTESVPKKIYEDDCILPTSYSACGCM